MKKSLSTFTAAIFMAMTIAGCKPEEPEIALPVLTPESEESVSVPAEGGEFDIAYKLENPVEGGFISVFCEPDADEWIPSIDYSTLGTVHFSVSPNESEEARSTEMTVRYDYSGGEPLSFSVEIKQNGMSGEEPDPDKATISFEVNEIGQRYFSVAITPSDKEMNYLVFFKTAEVFDMYPDTDSLIGGDMEYFAWMAYMNEMTDAQAVAAETIRGDYPDYLCNAEPETEYVLYAYGIDTLSLEVLTEVSVLRLTTNSLDKVDFTVETKADGHIVTAEIVPVDYDGYYMADAWAVDDVDAGLDFAVWCSNSWNTLRMDYEIYYGMTLEEIFEEYAEQGESSWVFEDLMPETDCIMAVFALDDMGWLCSEPVSAEFTTGSTTASGNVVTINVTNVTSRAASVEFVPSNDDPFAYIVTEAAQFEGMSDDEIIDYCMNRLYAPVRTGRYINTYGKLTPGTEYYAIAYGNYNGNITTELFLKSFTTNEAQVGALEFSLEYGPWYDLMQLAEADPNTGWDYSAMYYDCLLPVDVPEELADKEFYYMLYTTDAIYGWDDERLYNELYDNGKDYAPSYFLSDYGLEFVLVGFAVDDNGDWGPLWKSEPFTMSLEGASDPYDYVNR